MDKLKERLASIVALLDSFKELEDISTHVDEINSLSEEFDKIQAQIEAADKIAAISAKSALSTRQVSTKKEVTVEVRASHKDLSGGFNSFGDYLMSVKKAASGDVDKRFQNTMFERGGDGEGFLVPETFVTSISKKMESDDSLLARTNQTPVTGNSLTLPIDETTPWSGGVVAYWLSEGDIITDSKMKFGTASWKLNKVGALVKVTDELLEDATALEGYINRNAPTAIVHAVNSAIISGNGVGKPMGLLNSGFKVKVAKEVAQAADTIVAQNIIKMYTRLLPMSRRNAVWLINPMVESQLRLAKDDNGNYIYLTPGSQLNGSPYSTLLGLPVLPMLGGTKELGTEGDIILVDLGYYNTIVKSGGIKSAVSPHLYFDRMISAYRFIMRLDGSIPYKTPVKTEFGNYEMSGLVTLEDR